MVGGGVLQRLSKRLVLAFGQRGHFQTFICARLNHKYYARIHFCVNKENYIVVVLEGSSATTEANVPLLRGVCCSTDAVTLP